MIVAASVLSATLAGVVSGAAASLLQNKVAIAVMREQLKSTNTSLESTNQNVIELTNTLSEGLKDIADAMESIKTTQSNQAMVEARFDERLSYLEQQYRDLQRELDEHLRGDSHDSKP